jgi:MFS family permease
MSTSSDSCLEDDGETVRPGASLAGGVPQVSPNDAALKRDLRSIAADGTCYQLMYGLAEAYLSAYILHLGMGGATSGLFSALPMLFGAALQLFAPRGIRCLGSHRSWVVLCALIQASSLLALLAAEALPDLAGPIVLAAATLYWAGALGAAPAWNTWVEQLVPTNIRAPFFARRARFMQAGTLVGFVSAGMILHWASLGEHTTAAFIGIFTAASCCRFLSAWFLASQSDPCRSLAREEHLRLPSVLARFRHDRAARLVTYLMVVQVAVYFSGPYFAPFILGNLRHSFYDYTCLIGVTLAAKMICAPLWGRVAARIGSRGLLWIGGIGIAPVAGLWLFSNEYGYLLLVQAISGAMWSAYELAMVLVFFDHVPRRERTSLLTVYNFGNAAAQVLGAALGGWLLASLGETTAAYHALFGVSSVGRFVALSLLWLATREVLAIASAARSAEAHTPLRLPSADNAPAVPASRQAA